LVDARVPLFSLEIKVEAFCTIDSLGRKAYTKGSVIKWDVEIGSFSFELLMTSLCNAVKWSRTQCPTAWYYDKRVCEDVRLENQFQMNDIFEMYKDQMRCQIVVGVFDQSVASVDQFDALEPLCVIPPDIGNAIPTDSNVNQPSSKADDAPKVPMEAEVEPELEPDREPDMFDNDEEYVGYDDEGMYMPIPPTQPHSSSQPHSNSPPHVSHDAVNDDAHAFPTETEVNDADPEEIHVIHDPEHPKIEKGELFPDIVSFRKAIRHYAVTKGFELAGIKTDPTRYIARCKAERCPWRIHASRLHDKKTIQVTDHALVHLCIFICLT